jgi:hypothetical protein
VSEETKNKGVKSSLGVMGALVTILSIWWFALRPRSKQRDQ